MKRIAMIGLFVACLAGCATTQEQVEMRAAEAEAVVKAFQEAGVEGTATIVIEGQPARVGLFEGVVVEAPVRLRVVIVANLKPEEPTDAIPNLP